ncbi:MAG: hypothetical protein KGZ75_07285 [Syntrophomonadaceae bacterium]|jgi:hypothetical protein|nr:hypothetical protein [Syntrophomonadaceae bacterium]
MDYSPLLLMELTEAREVLENAGNKIRVNVTGSSIENQLDLNLRVIRQKIIDHNQIELVVAHFEHSNAG